MAQQRMQELQLVESTYYCCRNNGMQDRLWRREYLQGIMHTQPVRKRFH